MKTMIFTLLTLAFLESLPCGASASDDLTTGTGNQLIQWCNEENINSTDVSNLGYQLCLSYVDGIIEGLNLGAGLVVSHYKHTQLANIAVQHPKDGLDFCLPSNVVLGQEARVVSKYLKDNPDKLNDPSWSLVYLAIKGAWPCGKA